MWTIFLLFGDDRSALKAQGQRVREYVQSLRLRIHPDKFRLNATDKGVDFVGFVVFSGGRIRLRDSEYSPIRASLQTAVLERAHRAYGAAGFAAAHT